MRFITVTLAIFLITPFIISDLAKAQSAPAVWISVNKKSYSPGESGVLTINFKTSSKIKIPKEPEIKVGLTSGDVEGQGLQDYSGGEGDYLSPSKVKYNFIVPSGAESGSRITISGDVKFGYCSTVDGVCKLASKSFSTKITVK